MAVSGKTAAPHEIPYFLDADKPPNMATVTKAMADRIQLRLDAIAPKQITGVAKKQLLIANASGVVTAVTASGDVTNDESGVFTIGAGKVTEAKIASGFAGLRGSVIAAGSVSTGEGFTAEKTGTGAYLIKFTVAFAVKPVVTVSPNSALAVRATIAQDEKTTEQIRIRTWNAEGVATDIAFHFCAVAPTGE